MIATEAQRVAKTLAMLHALHEAMSQGTGVHPCDIGDEIGCIIAVLQDGYDPDEGEEAA